MYLLNNYLPIKHIINIKWFPRTTRGELRNILDDKSRIRHLFRLFSPQLDKSKAKAY